MLAKLMVGRDIVLADMRARPADAAPMSAMPVLSLENVFAIGDSGNEALHGISLDVRAGEIVGVAGVAGNGQRELSQVLTGIRSVSAGRILIDGKPVDKSNAAAFAENGIGHIPEDRLHSGLAPALSITVNAVMREYKKPPSLRAGATGRVQRRRLPRRSPLPPMSPSQISECRSATSPAATSSVWLPAAKCASRTRC
jgi:ABC-type uncharacterized transport system ATPase subunit